MSSWVAGLSVHTGPPNAPPEYPPAYQHTIGSRSTLVHAFHNIISPDAACVMLDFRGQACPFHMPLTAPKATRGHDLRVHPGSHLEDSLPVYCTQNRYSVYRTFGLGATSYAILNRPDVSASPCCALTSLVLLRHCSSDQGPEHPDLSQEPCQISECGDLLLTQRSAHE